MSISCCSTVIRGDFRRAESDSWVGSAWVILHLNPLQRRSKEGKLVAKGGESVRGSEILEPQCMFGAPQSVACSNFSSRPRVACAARVRFGLVSRWFVEGAAGRRGGRKEPVKLWRVSRTETCGQQFHSSSSCSCRCGRSSSPCCCHRRCHCRGLLALCLPLLFVRGTAGVRP